jgi:hypothetical protein
MIGRSVLEVSAAGPSWAGHVRAYRPGGQFDLGCLAGRTVGGFRHVRRRPAAAECPHEQLIGGDGGQAGVRLPHLAEAGGRGHVRHAAARSWRCPPIVSGLGARADGRMRRWVGQRYQQAARVRRLVAGRPQASRRAGRAATANRSAWSKRRARYREANRTHPVSAELKSLSIYQLLLALISPFSPATSPCPQPHVSYYLAACAIPPRAILTVIPVVLHIRICDARLPAGRGREVRPEWRCQ